MARFCACVSQALIKKLGPFAPLAYSKHFTSLFVGLMSCHALVFVFMEVYMTDFNGIVSRNGLADYLNIPRSVLSYILFIKGVDWYYTEFDIPKKSGGYRRICAPIGDLKEVQQQLASALWEYQKSVRTELGIEPNISHAFEKGKSIITNAKIHRNKRLVINVDLKDFFDSFHIGRVCGFFEKNKYYNLPHAAAVTIAQLACYQGKLPQGAPTSPIITNLICQVLDMHLLALAKRYHLDYTRYADDLTFSTNDKNFLEKWSLFYEELEKEIQKAGFLINEDKTRIAYRDSKQVVTGLVVNKKISVDHTYCRKVRAMAHSLYTNGSYEVDGVKGNVRQLEGRFAFIDQIEKQNNKCDSNGKHDVFHLSGRELQYQQFLFFHYFFEMDKPLIATEGKTDVLYIKAALKSLYEEYPELIEKDSSGNFTYKVNFLKRSNRFKYLFGLAIDGADSLTYLYNHFAPAGKDNRKNYLEYFLRITNRSPRHPVVFLYDNEMQNSQKPLYKFAKHARLDSCQKESLRNDLFLRLTKPGNLFLVTNPLPNGLTDGPIEYMLPEETRGIKLSGKALSLDSKFDNTKFYGKDIFSKYVLDNYENIDFSGFRPILNAIKSVLQVYKESIEE